MGMEVISPSGTAGDRRQRRNRGVSPGFSLIEVLIAGAILLVVALGTLPLFTRAMISNKSGAESTSVSNFARERLEEFNQLPFDSPDLTIDAGTSKVFDEYYSLQDKRWKDYTNTTIPTTDPAGWTRTTTVRQYSVTALDDGKLDPAEALGPTALPINVHFKEIVVAVQSARLGGPLGPGKRIALRILKSQ